MVSRRIASDSPLALHNRCATLPNVPQRLVRPSAGATHGMAGNREVCEGRRSWIAAASVALDLLEPRRDKLPRQGKEGTMRVRCTAIAAITAALVLGAMAVDASAQMHCNECDFSTACNEECYYYEFGDVRWTTCGGWGMCEPSGPSCSSACGPLEPCDYSCQDELGQWMSCTTYTSGQCGGVCEPGPEDWKRNDLVHGQWTQVEWVGPWWDPDPVCHVWVTAQVRYEDQKCGGDPRLEECYLDHWGTYPDTTNCCDRPPFWGCWGEVWPASCQA
jgi:hypothetical protein